jgi:hypothetical protein
MDLTSPLVPAVIGGLITLFASVVTFLATLFASNILSKTNKENELIGWAIKAAIEDFSADIKAMGSPKSIPPLSAYTYYHFHFFKLLEAGEATPRNVEKLANSSEKIAMALSGKIWRTSTSHPQP